MPEIYIFLDFFAYNTLLPDFLFACSIKVSLSVRWPVARLDIKKIEKSGCNKPSLIKEPNFSENLFGENRVDLCEILYFILVAQNWSCTKQEQEL